MVRYFPSQTNSDLMIVTFAHRFWLWSRNYKQLSFRHVDFFEVIRLNVEIFYAFEVRSDVANIFVTRDNILHRKRIYLQKNESSILKNNVKVFRNNSHSRRNTRARRNKSKKNNTVRVTARDPSRKVSHPINVAWDRKIVAEFNRSISSPRLG